MSPAQPIYNTLADSLERAREEGRNETAWLAVAAKNAWIEQGQEQVLRICRALLPGTDVDAIETRLSEATTSAVVSDGCRGTAKAHSGTTTLAAGSRSTAVERPRDRAIES